MVGCTPEKAKSLRIATEQFSNQALVAIDKMSNVLKKEVTAPSVDTEKRTENFINALVGLDAEIINSNDFEFESLPPLADPEGIKLSQKAIEAKQAFLDRLRGNYSEFSVMFARLEAGSFFSGDAVAKADTVVVKLTADMVAIAKHFSDNPPKLLLQRNNLMAQIRKIHADKKLDDSQKRAKYAPILARVDQLIAQELELQKEVVEASIKAAVLGVKVRKMAAEYGTISVESLQNMVLMAIKFQAGFTGNDMGALKGKVDNVFAQIESDEVYKTVVNTALREINTTKSAASAASPVSGNQ